MNLKRTSTTLLALLVAGSLLGAQVTKKTQEATKPAEATATATPGAVLCFPVAGLKQDNMAQVKTSLTELTIDTYACTPCMIEQIVPGRCGKCGTDLVAKKVPLFINVAPSLEPANVTLTLDQRRPAPLSKIESALARTSVKLDPVKLPISCPAALVFHGGTADAVATVQNALNNSGLFGEVNTSWEPTRSEIIARIRPGRTPATQEQVMKLSEPLKIQLVDVVFGPTVS